MIYLLVIGYLAVGFILGFMVRWLTEKPTLNKETVQFMLDMFLCKDSGPITSWMWIWDGKYLVVKFRCMEEPEKPPVSKVCVLGNERHCAVMADDDSLMDFGPVYETKDGDEVYS